MSKDCKVCGLQVPEYHWGRSPGARIQCRRCGTYLLSELVAQRLLEYGSFPEDRAETSWAWSGAIREQNELGNEPVIRSLEQLNSMVTVRKNPIDSINRLLVYLYRKASAANSWIPVDTDLDYPVAYAHGPDDFQYLIDKAKALGYIEWSGEFGSYSGGPGSLLRLDIKGWDAAIELQSKMGQPDQAFVAMWFSPDMDEAVEHGIRQALTETGYEPLRIDMSEHNEKIDDRIIAEIRRSGLVIADFTGQRGGVYFEAGFAMGLGIPVIWTCREDQVEELHFDTRQYNHVVWSGPKDLRERLRYRIEATHPRHTQ